MSCEYCTPNSFGDCRVHDFLNVIAYIKVDSPYWIIHVETRQLNCGSWIDSFIPITHCPWCGEELKEYE